MFANRFAKYNNARMQIFAYTFLDLHRNPYSKGIHRPLYSINCSGAWFWGKRILLMSRNHDHSNPTGHHFCLLPELVQLTQKRWRAELAPDCLAFDGYQFKPWQDFHCLICSCQCHIYSTKLLSFISSLENFCNIIKFFKHFLSHSRMLINHLMEI